MIRVIHGEDGAVYASSDNEQATVDELSNFCYNIVVRCFGMVRLAM